MAVRRAPLPTSKNLPDPFPGFVRRPGGSGPTHPRGVGGTPARGGSKGTPKKVKNSTKKRTQKNFPGFGRTKRAGESRTPPPEGVTDLAKEPAGETGTPPQRPEGSAGRWQRTPTSRDGMPREGSGGDMSAATTMGLEANENNVSLGYGFPKKNHN